MEHWFTSDLHLFHKNILIYTKRPFKDILEMNKEIQNNINECVRTHDSLYILGDISFGHPKWLTEWLSRIKCKNICIIWGNHDKCAQIVHKHAPNYFKWTENLKEIKIGNQDIILCHYPLRIWNKKHYGSWHFYGHEHNTLPGIGKSIDVGVDAHNFKPISFTQLKEIMYVK